MAIWFGGHRLPPGRTYTYVDPVSGAWVRISPREDGGAVIAARVYGASGRPALTAERILRPGDDFDEREDGTLLSVKPPPEPLPPDMTKKDILVAFIACGPGGAPLFEMGHDGFRVHAKVQIHVS